MLILQLALLLLLLTVCCFAPGFYFVRRFAWNPREKLCGSVCLSLILLYLASWTIYCLVLPWTAASAVVSMVAAALAVAARKDILRLSAVASVRRALWGFLFLLVWMAALLGMIRGFAGGRWFSDWLEHFQRTLFFLDRLPVMTQIFPNYALPARPPMMNVLAAFFLAQTAPRFELFEAVFAFLNLLLFLPCCLIMPALGRKARRRTPLLTLLFAASPVIMQNTAYTWTKANAAFFVVLAFWFYLAGWRKRDSLRTIAAFVTLAAGFLVHYSVGPYIVFLGMHYALVIFPERPRWKELARVLVICGLLIGTWMAWSWVVYGPEITLGSNSTVVSGQQVQGSVVVKIYRNLYYSLIPAVIRRPALLNEFNQPNVFGWWRDRAFVFYQHNLIFAMGLVGGPFVLWLVWRELRRAAPVSMREQKFWPIAIVCCVLLGIAVVGERDPLGVPHLTLLPLEALGLTLLAAAIPLERRAVGVLLLAGCVVDFSAGVYLHARMESKENAGNQVAFGSLAFEGQMIRPALLPNALSASAWNNWYLKRQYELSQHWLRELPARYQDDPAFHQVWPPIQGLLQQAIANDRDNWHGWWARHGGEVEFLGDRVAGASGIGTEIATGALLLLFAGLFAYVCRSGT